MSDKDIATIRIDNGMIIPMMGKRTMTIMGFDKLLSNVVKYLLSEEGSDPFNKEYGTSLTSLVGPTSNDIAYLEEVIYESLDKTKNFFEAKRVAALVAGNPLPAEETLGSLDLVSLEIVVDSLIIYVSISNDLGSSSTLKLNLG